MIHREEMAEIIVLAACGEAQIVRGRGAKLRSDDPRCLLVVNAHRIVIEVEGPFQERDKFI